jgi:hypothetical protein
VTKGLRVGERAGLGIVGVAPHREARGVGVVEAAAVGREGEAVRGEQAVDQRHEAAPVVAVEVGRAAGLRLVDGAEQEAAARIGPAVVEAAGRMALGVRGELRDRPALGVEAEEPGAHPGDEAAARPEADAADVLGHRQPGVAAVAGAVAVDGAAGDVDEVERRLGGAPERALAELGPQAVGQDRARGHRGLPPQ